MKVYEADMTEELERELIRLSAEWESENSCWGYRANTREDLAGRRVILAEEDGAVIGYLLGLRETAERRSSVMEAGTPYFELEELYVVPARRSQGVGRRLFAMAEEAARAEGLSVLMLTTATKNAKAILHFYLDELRMEFWSARLLKRLG